MICRLVLTAALVVLTLSVALGDGAPQWLHNDFSRCCGEAECTPIPEMAVTDNQDGSYTVKKTQERVTDPRLFTTQDGQIWWCRAPSGHTYCLFTLPKGS